MQKPIAERIRQRIKKKGEGSVFLVRDFLDFGTAETVSRTLSRLAKEGLIRRVGQGVYEYPRFSELLGRTAPPSVEAVTAAVARRTGHRILPTEAQMANFFGLTTQIQAKSIYITDGGRARRVKVGSQTVELRPVTARRFPNNPGEAVIQALRWVGEPSVTEEMIERLRRQLTGRQKAALRRKIAEAPAWMQPAIRQITETEAVAR